MRARQAKKIIKWYLSNGRSSRGNMTTLIQAMKKARRRKWTTAYCWRSWRMTMWTRNGRKTV